MNSSIFAAVTAGFVVFAANAEVIDFEDAPGSENPIYENTPYNDSSGFSFIGEHFHTVDTFDIGAAGTAQNGSDVYIGHEGGSLGRAITMTRTAGGAFDVFSLDAAELWIGDDAGFPNAYAVEVTGFFEVGGSITDVLVLDGILDGAGGAPDFQTFSLVGFTDLIAFEFNGVDEAGAPNFAFGVDNINLVPAPGAAALLCLGGLFVRRRR